MREIPAVRPPGARDGRLALDDVSRHCTRGSSNLICRARARRSGWRRGLRNSCASMPKLILAWSASRKSVPWPCARDVDDDGLQPTVRALSASDSPVKLEHPCGGNALADDISPPSKRATSVPMRSTSVGSRTSRSSSAAVPRGVAQHRAAANSRRYSAPRVGDEDAVRRLLDKPAESRFAGSQRASRLARSARRPIRQCRGSSLRPISEAATHPLR